MIDLSERVAVALERLAASNERIVEMADEERQANYQGGPAYCPHCGRMHPVVSVPSATGNMGEYILTATCQGCDNVFYAVPEGWQIFKTLIEMQEAGQ
jgi:lysyl-tRNA synthetase class I